MGDHDAQGPGDARLEVRVSDAERDDVITILREQTTAGRLTLEEFEDRLGEVYGASTSAQLRHVLRELPVQPPPTTAAGVAAPGGLEERTEEELRRRWRRRLRGDLVGFATPNLVCHAIWFLGEMQYWWPGWVLLGTGVGIAGTLARGFDPDAERELVSREQRARAMAEIEMRKLLRDH